MRVRLLGLAAVVLAATAALVWDQRQTGPVIVSGFVEADEIRVGSRIGGRVREVRVEEGAQVEAGAVLVVLEPFDLRERLAEAEARLAAAAANHEKLSSGFRSEETAQAKARRDQAQAALDEAVAGPREQEIEASRDELKLAQAELELAGVTFARAEALFGKKSVSKEDYDRVRSERKVAQATVDARTQGLQMLEEGTRSEQIAQAKASLAEATAELQLRENGYRAEDVAEAKAEVDARRAAVEAIREQIKELTVLAPTASVVEAVDLQPGDLIAANAPVISLMGRDKLWVRAYVPENLLGLVTDDRELAIGIDSYPGQRFRGRVSFVARNAEFTPSNVQTPEERSKQVFRFKVRIEDGLDKLRPGMTADVYLKGDDP